jgi:hypothetical protein
MKSKIKNGYYPISISHIKRLINNCEKWGYGNKDTCKYVAESIIEWLRLNYTELIINDTLYNELVSITHDLNNGSLIEKIEIKFV